MKHSVAKTFRTIFIVLAVILLVLTAFLYYIDTPVIEEGQEPTIAQKLTLLGKQYLGEILAICGVSAVGLIGILVKLIYNSAKKTSQQSEITSAEVAELKQELAENKAENRELCKKLSIMDQKQDILTNALLTTFSLSELPASLREKISDALTAYNELGKAKVIVDQVVEKVVKAVQPEEVAATVIEIVEKSANAEDKTELATPTLL